MATLVCNNYKIPVFWDDTYKTLDYVHEEFNDKESLIRWQEQGYSNKVTGWMCDMRNTQPNWNDKFIKIYKEFGWKDIGTSYYRMDTGTILPTHSDLYVKYIKLFNLEGQEHTIRRAVVFLEDWASGHYAECAGKPYVKWEAGTVLEWAYDTPHLAANLGLAPRYTLQITGHL
jgi:hypothetical protein